MRIAIAGGSGFLGSHVCDALRGQGHAVRVLSRGSRQPLPGVENVPCDVTRDVPVELLEGCAAVVNLIGIKREDSRQTFARAHVDVTRRLISACHSAGVRRFIHVSVVCSRPDAKHPYQDTKWQAEELVRASGLAFTILRPGVIYGRGDDMVTQLVRMLRFAPFFPVVSGVDCLLQPVDVRDVALAVAASLERPSSAGQSIDIVGPSPMTLRQVVETVAAGMSLPVQVVSVPLSLQRIAVHTMEATMRAPLSTPAQLQMLIDGMSADPGPAARELGLAPRPFTPDAVGLLEAAIGPLFGFSLRLVDTRAHRTWLAAHAPRFRYSLALAGLALVLQVLLGAVIPNVWFRVGTAGSILSVLAVCWVGIDWRLLFRPSWRHVASGTVAASVLYAAGWLVVAASLPLPGAAAQIAQLHAWKNSVPSAVMLPLLLFIVATEEIVWRSAVTLPFAARLGPWLGALAAGSAFALAHVPLGVPLLVLAAIGAGTFWSLLVVKTRSAVPSLVCHILWDLAVLVWFPYRL